MTTLSVGKEVVSYCGKCKLSLGHIIASMQGDKIDKVICNTCKANHKHKDASQAKKAHKKMLLGSSKARSKAQSDDLWKETMEKATLFLPYTPQSQFKTGDVLDHSKFGQGFVEKLIDTDKIEVLFREGYKTLVHKK